MMMQSFAEGLNLAEEVEVDPQVLLDVISLSAIASPMFKLKVRRIWGMGLMVLRPGLWGQGTGLTAEGSAG